jgi:ABC-type dipeptide/oligopeptide/nickel transport system ATPase component
MPQQTKVFRVFVSSTFTDMREERRILQSDVFPKLEQFCQSKGAKFQAVDLRWGINEKTQLNQKTLQTCLNEVKRCQKISPKPNFLVLLGDKYGWQPIPEKIPATEWDEIIELASEDNKVLNEWYKLDTNAVPSEYILQELKGEYKEYDNWKPIEKKIRQTLRDAVDKLGYKDSKRIKYFTSATHQEVINGVYYPPEEIENPNKHVFAFERVVQNLPDNESAKDYIDLDGDKRDSYSVDQLQRLKYGKEGNGLIKRLGKDKNYNTYTGTWDAKEKKVHIDDDDKFADDVYEKLFKIIDAQIEGTDDKSEIKQEIQLHEDFMKKLIEHFRGRKESLKSICSYIDNPVNKKTLSVIGESGSGKTSVMAKAVSYLLHKLRNDSTVIAYRFLGTTSKSSNVINLMQSVAGQIAKEFGTDLKKIVGQENEKSLNEVYVMSEAFKKCLALATDEKPVIVFLDALDQLSETDNAKALHWLPKELPKNVKLIISSLPELKDRLQDTTIQELLLLPKEESEIILKNWLNSIKRTLTKEQFEYILQKENSNLAIYLKLVFEQVNNLPSYDETLKISDTVEGIIKEFIERLEIEHDMDGLVEHVISYMLCGRYGGLAENEILDILVFDKEYWKLFLNKSHKAHRKELKKAKKIPIAVWSKLYLDLEPYLTERDADGVPIITFFHRQFNEVLRKKYDLVEEGEVEL